MTSWAGRTMIRNGLTAKESRKDQSMVTNALRTVLVASLALSTDAFIVQPCSGWIPPAAAVNQQHAIHLFRVHKRHVR